MKHALITGGAGFIGSHLSDLLLERGIRVAVLDDLSTGQRENLVAAQASPLFSFIEGDAGDEKALCGLLDGVDTVFHLAAVVGVKKVMEDPVMTIEKNFHTTEAVLHASNERNIRTIIASSSEVYGSNPKASFSEDDDSIIGNSLHTRWCYAAGKLMDEFHALALFHKENLPVTVVRLFNTIGPRQVGSYGMVVPTFVRQALAQQPITVYGSGQQCRCFTYVKDVVRCLADIADTPACIGNIFNIGNCEEISIRQLAETVLELTGSASAINCLSYGEVFGEDFVDMERRVPDQARLREAIGYAPDTPLKTVLLEIIESFKTVTA